MANIEIDAQDVATASNFLEQFLSNAVPDGDFSKGTALRDLTIGAISAVFAFLRQENTDALRMQSLKTVQEAVGTTDPAALKDAVAAILSNVFINLKSGSKSRGYVIGHATELTDVFVPTTARFTSANGLVFTVDSTETYFIAKTELTPVIDSDESVLDYEFRIPLVATKIGVEYDIEAGLFSSFDRFNPFVTRIENPEKFAGGKGTETVEEVLERAPNALSVRNLINDRSINAVLNETFPEIHSLLVVGMGDPEMQRDVLIGMPEHLLLHVGGMVDIYLLLDLVETTFTGEVGDLFARPDGLATVFRDSSQSFAAVEAGDIIRVTDGLDVVPAEFMVVENTGDELIVSERSPFPIASDEGSPPTTVSYTIGRIGPSYVDVLADVGNIAFTTGVTSRQIGESGRITLPGGPVVDILDVAVLDPAVAEDPYTSAIDGFVHFPNHVNTTPNDTQTPDEGLEFRTIVHNPLYAQSTFQWMEIVVGTDLNQARFDGNQLRVRYRTLSAFATIDDFVRSRRQRTSAAHQLPRGHHPITVEMEINYKLKSTATSTLDDDAIVSTVVDFINTFDTSVQPIDTSALEQHIRNSYPSIAAITPLVVQYTLRAPTGDLLQFETEDEVLLIDEKKVSGPDTVLLSYGVSDRTVRYVANDTGIRALQVT
jgi:hypothetical protein